MNYERVAQTIKFLTENYRDQPTLNEVASKVGLSKYHFQKTFKAFTGISPKQFLQVLTGFHARRLLRASSTVLDAALDVGLSGPSRLHDLMVTLEAMTPGEQKERGRYLKIHFGFGETPFGCCLIAKTSRGICWMSFLKNGECKNDALSKIKDEWSNAEFTSDNMMAQAFIGQVFNRNESDVLPVHVRGTNFQIRVWKAILSIPSGSVASYGKIASLIMSPNSARTVGSALAKNPVAVLIPCHRVIRESGIIGNYKWEEYRKKALLAWEVAKINEYDASLL